MNRTKETLSCITMLFIHGQKSSLSLLGKVLKWKDETKYELSDELAVVPKY